MTSASAGSAPGEHAVYPGTFDPVTPGHLDVIERARHLFARVTVLVAVNSGKQPGGSPPERAARLREAVPAGWDNVTVATWDGLTVAFCAQHGAGVIIRGVRNRSDLRQEYQLAAMNQALGVTTLLLPARPGLAGTSSTSHRLARAGLLSGRAAQARRTGSDSRPFMRLTGRQRSSPAGTASDIAGKRASSAPRATSASIRASGAPRQ